MSEILPFAQDDIFEMTCSNKRLLRREIRPLRNDTREVDNLRSLRGDTMSTEINKTMLRHWQEDLMSLMQQLDARRHPGSQPINWSVYP
jgi:hypothetical protein